MGIEGTRARGLSGRYSDTRTDAIGLGVYLLEKVKWSQLARLHDYPWEQKRMETVAWVGALETAIAILYLALIGQRSIAQWLDDRRKQRSVVKKPGQEAPQESVLETSASTPGTHARLLSVQSIGDYLEYVWRDPAEAGLITAKALTLALTLLAGATTLLLTPTAVILGIIYYFSGGMTFSNLANQIGTAAVFAGLASSGGVFLAWMAVTGAQELADNRKREQEQREREERAKAQRQATAERRRTAQQ